MISGSIDNDPSDITSQNLQSRARGVTLMALANEWNALLLTTGNKSEMAMGYATLYGDMCGAYNPLKDVYKTQVYELVKWRNQNRPYEAQGPSGQIIPSRVITRAPSAELKPFQTDQDTLPPYDVLDQILFHLIERDTPIETAMKDLGFEPSMVFKVWQSLLKAEYKRRQAPPGPRVSSLSFGRDWRYPITNHFGQLAKVSS
jgi:NAD+ synthase